MQIAHVRSFLARHRAARWVFVTALAGVVAAVLAAQSAALERERRSWGEGRTVWIASTDLAPGDPVLVQAVSAPPALVAPTAVIDDPSASIALRPVATGEILVIGDVGDRDELAPADRRRVAVAADETTLAVSVGDVVDVIDAVAAGAVVATDAVVVEVTPTAVVVAVPASAAPMVAAAALERRAVLAGHG